jgi:hypothetical protein
LERREGLSYVAIQKDASARELGEADSKSSETFVSQVASALANFAKYYKTIAISLPIESEAQLMGALSGFLTGTFPEAQIATGRRIYGSRPFYVDIMISLAEQAVIIELKRGNSPSLEERGVAQLLDYLEIAKAKYGILFLYSDNTATYDVTILEGQFTGAEIHIVRPKKAQLLSGTTK